MIKQFKISDFTTRVLKAIDTLKEKNLVKSDRQFAFKIGLDPTQLSFARQGKRNIPDKYAIEIEEFFNVSKHFLKNGHGEILKSIDKVNNSYTDEMPISNYRVASPPVAEAEYNARQVSGSSTPNMYLIPLKAYGGFLSGYEKKVYSDSIQKVPFPLVKGECYSFEVDGSSMLDEFCPGDYFVGVPLESFTWMVKGKPYVFQTIDGLILKCFDRIENNEAYLFSTNPDYNPVKPIHLKDIKVVYHKEFVIKR